MKATFCSVSGLIVCLITVSVQAQTLTHSYTFKDLTAGNVADGTTIINQATGVADATLKLVGTGTATVNDNHTLTLNGIDGGNGAYISLPNDVIGTKTSMTVESWVTANQLLKYSRVFDFGNGSNATDFFMALSQNVDGNSYVLANNAITDGYKLTTGQEYLLTATHTGTSLNYYVNGALISSKTASALLPAVSETNYVGKSHWGDSYADATFSEFNVYDGAKGAAAVKVEYLAGSNATPGMNKELTAVKAAQVDNVISQAAGFFSVSSAGLGELTGKITTYGFNGNINTCIKTSSYFNTNLLDAGYVFHDGTTDANNAYGYSADTSLRNISGSLSLAARVNLHSFTTTNGTYVDLIRASSSENNDGLYYGLSLQNGVLQLAFRDGNSNYFAYTLQDALDSDITFETDKWYDFAASFDNVAQTVSLFAYDTDSGELLFSDLYENVTPTSILTGTGGDFLLMEAPGDRHGTIDGMMAYAGVWGMALTQADFAALSGQVVIPEPSTWLLMILGIVGLTWIRSRKK